jgi:hypothetical protein
MGLASRLTTIPFGSGQGSTGITTEIGGQEAGRFWQGQVQMLEDQLEAMQDEPLVV